MKRVAVLILFLSVPTSLAGQTKTYRLSGAFDSSQAPSSDALPGLRGAYRAQILIEERRLAGLKGKKLAGLLVRRDLSRKFALAAGTIDLSLRVSVSSRAPGAASTVFAQNAAPSAQTLAFDGAVTVPSSPAPSATSDPWSVQNSIQVVFSTPFFYPGGTLVLDLSGAPQAGREPSLWYVGYEFVNHDGSASVYGSTCSTFSASGDTLQADEGGLQIGASLRVTTLGRPGASPMLLIGAGPTSMDLTPIGAVGCHQYVSYFLMVGLRYLPQIPHVDHVGANFLVQVPAASSLLGAELFLQSADNETRLPRSEWTNPAGLTTSNGLKLQIASQRPALGMALVVSHEVDAGQPFPAFGTVDARHAPVLRLLYTDK